MDLINKIQFVSLKIQWLRLPSIAIALLSIIVIVSIIFSSHSNEENKLLIPGILCLLWSMNLYILLSAFKCIPEKADATMSLFKRIKQNIYRSGYWLITISFIIITIFIIFLSNKLFHVWLKEYGL